MADKKKDEKKPAPAPFVPWSSGHGTFGANGFTPIQGPIYSSVFGVVAGVGKPKEEK